MTDTTPPDIISLICDGSDSYYIIGYDVDADEMTLHRHDPHSASGPEGIVIERHDIEKIRAVINTMPPIPDEGDH